MEGGSLLKKNVDSSIEENNEKGAKILATGSSSCIFHPNIPCKKSNDDITKEKISKIVYGSKSDKYFKREQKINDLIRRIDNYSKWALIYDKYCSAPTYENILKNYDKDILKCLDREYEEKFNSTNHMMIGDYGGITFEDYFVENILKCKTTKTIDKHMYILFKKMEPLFFGLKVLHQKKIVHLDIKIQNIVIHEGVFKYIDFGLASKLSDDNHFKTRSLSEFNNKRIYLWYPMEYLYSYASHTELLAELLKFNTTSFRKHYEKGKKIHKLLKNTFEDHIKLLLNDKQNYNHTELNSLIDTYSLGLLIPYLFVDYNIIKHINKSDFLKEIFDLFSKMCALNYKERLTPDESYKIYESILNKYSSLEKGTKKKTLRKKK